MKVDLIIKNGYVYNSYFKKFFKRDIAILDEKFYYIGRIDPKLLGADQVIDCENSYLIPGLIDIHLHIESSMTIPPAFSHELIKNGVTTVVAEPHEIANTFGVEGIKEMLKAGKDCALDIFYGIPSSVPSTSQEFETSGAALDIEDIKELMTLDNIICLGEVMNYYDIINNTGAKINAILNFFRKKYPHLPVEGHCPRITGLELANVIYKGIDSDHTHQTVEGLRERIENGMFVEIQEKSMSPEVIDFLVKNELYEHFCFVSDDVMADTLVEEGHLNKLVKKAVKMGMKSEYAIYASTYTPARRMGLKDRGSIAPGKLADFVLLDNVENFNILKVYKKGRKVYDKDEEYPYNGEKKLFPAHFYRSVKLPAITGDKFKIKAPVENGKVKCRVIKVMDKTTFTEEIIAAVDVKNGYLDWENSPYCVVAVFERYTNSGRFGIGLITGDTIKRGAVAATYAHDHHNLIVVGKSLADTVTAANTVIKSQGGYCAVLNGRVLAHVDLPVGGILSEESLLFLGNRLSHLRKAMKDLGYKHYNPIMSFSTVSLPVSPKIKITDRGLIKLSDNSIVQLFLEE
ncbi:MAG: adenine deaminase [Clostridia bacterium]|jgi:adenine deaminase|nr:hypothetical protein [Clostridiales bacterium]MDK2986447.1 adenine deaminase [Clostridia bacterium]